VIAFQQTDSAALYTGAGLTGQPANSTTLDRLCIGTPGTTVTTLTLDAGASDAYAVSFDIPVPYGVDWRGGRWVVRLNIPGFNARVTWNMTHCYRLNGSGVVQGLMGTLQRVPQVCTTPGVKQMVVPTEPQPLAVRGDRVCVVCSFVNQGPGTQAIGVVSDQGIDAPFELFSAAALAPPATFFDGGESDRFVMTTLSAQGLGSMVLAQGVTLGSSAWPGGGAVMLFPIVLKAHTGPRTYTGMLWLNGSVVSGNIDAGLYDLTGTRLASVGSTPQSGTAQVQRANFATPVTLAAGRYYVAVSLDNTTGTLYKCSAGNLSVRAHGGRLAQPGSNFPLPATFNPTWIPTTQTYTPWVGAVEGTWT
jgi:hypothetical protein